MQNAPIPVALRYWRLEVWTQETRTQSWKLGSLRSSWVSQPATPIDNHWQWFCGCQIVLHSTCIMLVLILVNGWQACESWWKSLAWLGGSQGFIFIDQCLGHRCSQNCKHKFEVSHEQQNTMLVAYQLLGHWILTHQQICFITALFLPMGCFFGSILLTYLRLGSFASGLDSLFCFSEEDLLQRLAASETLPRRWWLQLESLIVSERC